MRLTPRQRQVVDHLHNGAFIWTAGEAAYLALQDPAGRVKSQVLNHRIFQALQAATIIKQEGKKWVLSP